MAKQGRGQKSGKLGAASIVAIVLSFLLYFFNGGFGSFGKDQQAAMNLPDTKGLRVHYIDVNQGDGILIQCDGEAMLLDAGKNDEGQRVISYLKKEGIRKLNVIVGTHPHEDHIGGLDMVIDEFEVGKVILPEVSTNTRTFEDLLDSIDRKGLKIEDAKAGQSFKLGGAEISILSPGGSTYEDMNNNSVVLRLVYGKRAFLFTGDAGELAEQDIMASGATLGADVLKIGHHGSKYSTGNDFLEAVRPTYGVISVGKGNEYGHPAERTMKRLEEAGVTIYRTDLNGTIVFSSDGTSLMAESEK